MLCNGVAMRKPRACSLNSGRLSVAVAALALAMPGAGTSWAASVAKPPLTVSSCPSGAPTTAACIVPPAGPILPNFPAPAAGGSSNGASGFTITGTIQHVTATDACGTANSTAGGSVTVNGTVITIPSNTIVQYPANTLTWTDAVCGIHSIATDGSGGTQPAVYPGVEISVDGNIVAAPGVAPGPSPVAGVGSTHIASIVKISQQSVNSGSGYITAINIATGVISVATQGGTSAALMINDPKGRFGIAQSSPDARFQVDDANPTIKSAGSGYPMCVPRSGTSTASTDPRCPEKNRPKSACRNFAAAGVTIPAGGDLPTAVNAQGNCTAFVMKAISGYPGALAARTKNANYVVSLTNGETPTTEPDAREMAPLKVGDFITWQGTQVRNIGGSITIWVHTIDANVGIYTQPGTLPAYVAIGEMRIGVDVQPQTAAPAVGVEATPRIFLEAYTSDIASVIDLYLDDKGFGLPAGNVAGPLLHDNVAGPNGTSLRRASGSSEYFRWLTTESMTGTVADQVLQAAAGIAIPSSSTAQAGAFGGGIYTQFAGGQPGRARIRAIKVPAIDPSLPCVATAATAGGSRGCSITQSPTRYVRAVLRSLCAPAASNALSETADGAGNPVTSLSRVPSTNIDTVSTGNTGVFFNINGNRGNLPNAGDLRFLGGVNRVVNTAGGTATTADRASAAYVGPGNGSCLESAQYANGLFTGQYMAPMFDFLYPENTLAGFPVVPNNFWHMGFLVYGENGNGGNSTAAQSPQPW